MRTLYIRNVPDDVAERLERLAASAGLSVSRYTLRELVEIARRADNAALLDELADLDVDLATIVAAVDEGRTRR